MKNPGNLKAHLVLRSGVFQVQQQRIFNNSFLMMNKMDSYVIRQAFSLQPYSFILFYRVYPKSFRLLNLNMFRSTKSTKYFLNPYEYSEPINCFRDHEEGGQVVMYYTSGHQCPECVEHNYYALLAP